MAGENTPNYLAAVAPLATPVDTVRNPDVDAAMGFAADPNDDPSTAFAKGLQSSLFRNSPQGRDVTEAFVKTKLSNQLASQLEERKLQLQNQYQPYDASHVTPWGAVVLTGKSGATKTINPMGGDQNDPTTPAGLAFQTWQNQQKAAGMKAQYESSDDFYQRETDKANAETSALKSRAELESENAKTMPAYRQSIEDRNEAYKTSKTNPVQKPLTPQQVQQATQAALSELYPGYNPKDTLGFSPGNAQFQKDMQKDPDGTKQRLNQKTEEILSRNRASGLANPLSGAQDLLNLGSSPVFNPQQGMLDQ